ncbi:MAG: hypothetical protein IJF02_04250 [Oscillospiraceae bacterium]|nr:hypothetical protein [Oscillospiraceae bacterium]
MGNYPSVAPNFGGEVFEFNIAGILYLIYMLVVMAVGIGSYVFQSLGFYTIAKRRCIKKPWLSWIPVGNLWILGCISDQYQYVVKGKVKNKRKSVLILNILMWLFEIAVCVLFVVFIYTAVSMPEGGMETAEQVATFMGSMFGMMGLSIVLSGFTIAIVVIQYIALYDLFTSCDPKNNLLYLLLSIFVSITMPIFIFVCRNKELGMPPRKQDPAAFIPPEPVDVPPWRPVQNTAEPWDNTEE